MHSKTLVTLLLIMISTPLVAMNPLRSSLERDPLNWRAAVCQASSNFDLFDAVKDGDLAHVEELIANGADVNIVDSSGKTPLGLASGDGALSIVGALLAAEADVDGVGVCLGMRPTFYSVHCNRSSIDPAGMTPLYLAVENNHTAVVRMLLDAEADLTLAGKTAGSFPLLACAASQGFTGIVEALLDAGADPNECNANFRYGNSKLGSALCGGRFVSPLGSALGSVLEGGDFVAAKLLLDAGAYPNQKFDYRGNGFFPLQLAVKNGDLSLFKELLLAGADPHCINGDADFRDRDEDYLFDFAKISRLLGLLFAANADPNRILWRVKACPNICDIVSRVLLSIGAHPSCLPKWFFEDNKLRRYFDVVWSVGPLLSPDGDELSGKPLSREQWGAISSNCKDVGMYDVAEDYEKKQHIVDEWQRVVPHIRNTLVVGAAESLRKDKGWMFFRRLIRARDTGGLEKSALRQLVKDQELLVYVLGPFLMSPFPGYWKESLDTLERYQKKPLWGDIVADAVDIISDDDRYICGKVTRWQEKKWQITEKKLMKTYDCDAEV